MRDTGVDGFIEELLADRPPKSFHAATADAHLLRVAITLRAGARVVDRPDEQFVENLHRQLSARVHQHDGSLSFMSNDPGQRSLRKIVRSRPARTIRRRFVVVASAAAALLLVAGTIATGRVLTGHSQAPAAQTATTVADLRSGLLVTGDGRSLGRMYVYKGETSWVFMNVQSGGFAGVYTCELQLGNGTTVAVGTLELHDGSGVFVRMVRVNVDRLRSARLVTPTGSTFATVTFS